MRAFLLFVLFVVTQNIFAEKIRKPVAKDDYATTAEDMPVTLNVVENDEVVEEDNGDDEDGSDGDEIEIDPASVDLNTATGEREPSLITGEGVFEVDETGEVIFTPAPNFNGTAVIFYTVKDDNAAVSDPASITVDVASVNDSPVSNSDETTTTENRSVEIEVLSNDIDIDGTLDPSSLELTNETGGTFTASNEGVITYSPAESFNGTANANYTVKDNEGLASNASSITIIVTAENVAPVANPDEAATTEGTPISIDVISNDTDDDGYIDPGSVAIADPSGGTFTPNNAGVVTYFPATDFSGTATANYTVLDNEGLISNATSITVTVAAQNNAPIANADEVDTNENTPVTINVVSNDTDADGSIDPATVAITDPAGGTFTPNSLGIVTYSPTNDFIGTANAKYTVKDNEGTTSNVSTITVNVAAQNDPPVANNDATSTNENTPVTVNVLSNDTDPDGSVDAATVTIIDPSGGTFTANSEGVVSFTPTNGFTGTATASYTVNDNSGSTSNVATISVTVNAVNEAPVTVNDAATTNEDQPVDVNILANDTDDSSIDAASIALSGGNNGNYSVSSSGILTYTPTPDFNGTATVNYTVKDNEGATSDVATVIITVNSVNDPPTANNDQGSTSEDEAVTINVIENDLDVDGEINPATVAIGATQTGGTFIPNGAGGVTFTPNAEFVGTAEATYSIKDNAGATSNEATIRISVGGVNDNPVANNDEGSTNEDVPTTINVVANDTDPDGTINSATVNLSNAVGGTFITDASGNVTYTPQLNFSGTATAVYTVKDNDGATSNQATITIAVAPVSDGPVATNDVASTNEDEEVGVNVIINDVDPDGSIDPTSINLTSPSGGTFTASADGVVAYTPALNFSGVASAKYTIKDNSGQTSNEATISITVLPVNDLPQAVNDAATTNEETSVTINVVTNDIDVDGTITASSVTIDPGATGGTFTANPSGIVTFVPQANFVGAATASYTVQDNSGGASNHATITITVNSVNDPPIASPDNVTTNEDIPATFSLTSNDTDADGTINTSSIVISNVSAGTFVVGANGDVIFTPPLDFNGSATANYTVKDNEGATSNVALITVQVTDIEDAPVARNDQASTLENIAVTFNVTSNDQDVDGTVNTATVDLNLQTPGVQGALTTDQGSFTADAAGNVTFIPTAGFNGIATIKYSVNDNNGKISNQATITVTVTPVNDPPSFALIADQRILINSPQRIITIANISAGPRENEQLLLTATSGNTALIPNPSVTYNGTSTTATISFQPVANMAGTASITVKIVDGALNEFSQTFQIEVIDVRITSLPDSVAEVGELYEYIIEVSDVQETLTLVADQKPNWLTLTSLGKNKAKLTGTPPATGASSSIVNIQLKENTTILDDQQFVLIINHRPMVQPFTLSANEDEARSFSAEEFAAAFSDVDGNMLKEVQFTQLPKHGKLSISGAAITTEVAVSFSSLPNITYLSDTNYSGPDTLYWKGSDGYSYSKNSAFVTIIVAPLNDPPVVTNIESDSLVYEVGSEVAQTFTPAFDATDVDDQFLVGAEIGFQRPNFQPGHDMLEFINTPGISGVYNSDIGILTLTGEATVQEYVDAIRTIKYNYLELSDLTLENRKVYITLTDGKATSEEAVRTIDLFYTFSALDIPTGFTPNGDNANDSWKISSSKGVEQYEKAQIRIFNKRGELVFETSGFDTPWDGTMNGKALPVDTYYYTIDLNYNKIRYKGIVTILR